MNGSAADARLVGRLTSLERRTVTDMRAAYLLRFSDEWGPVCTYCWRNVTLGEHEGLPVHWDHVQPRKHPGRPGPHADRNLTLSCAPCNLAKGCRTPREWARHLGISDADDEAQDELWRRYPGLSMFWQQTRAGRTQWHRATDDFWEREVLRAQLQHEARNERQLAARMRARREPALT